MDNMDVDSPPETNATLKPRDRILMRLSSIGVPREYLDKQNWGLMAFVREHGTRLYEVVSTVLPSDEEVKESINSGSKQAPVRLTMKDRFRESMVWLQWLMFKGEPRATLKYLAEGNVGQRGVCGAVWGSNDIAYRCRTCEHDPTCAICVPCFQNGNHKDHDYSVIYTGGGCCDCGDVTAWKREGFCSKHKGAEQIQPLPEELSGSVGPVLDALFTCWRYKLLSLEPVVQKNSGASDRIAVCKKIANELTFAVVEMLLDFCKHSESLLSFVSKRLFSSDGLLAVLVKEERLLIESVVKKLHELLLKMLGEPEFKYEFAKVFLSYYPDVINNILKESSDEALKNYPIMSTFSVQILTVPTLTPRLVKEMNLLLTLLGCLGDIFKYCAGEDDQLRLSKWGNLYETTLRVLEDIRFVMSHDVVPIYVVNEQRDALKTWLRFLAYVQGMNPQKRETGIHMEEENENMHLPFVLCHSISNIHSLLVTGACAVSNDEKNGDITLKSHEHDTDDGGSLRHAKIGRLSQESSVGSAAARSSTLTCSSKANIESGPWNSLIPPAITWLTYECLKAIEKCFVVDSSSGSLNVLSQGASSICNSSFLDLKRTFSNFAKGKYIFGRFGSSGDDNTSQYSSTAHGAESVNSQNKGQEERLVNSCYSADDNAMETDCTAELQAFRFLSISDWPDLLRNSSSPEISVHIPLHRLLSLLVQKALKKCYGESASCSSLSTVLPDFFGHILSGCHPYGFSAFTMEHLLRIRVFCAEVHAGMWRKHADAPLILSECYRSIRWSGQDLDHDLFLLQCCAAMAPADLYVLRVLERFGLSNYLSLNLERTSHYEPVLVQEMLTLIIQIVKERRFSGLSTAGSLKRELVCKLATGDATHSQLVKSLPRDLSKSDELQEILDTVAQYSNPSGFNQGMYSLRLTYWKELDLYHPRWSSRELQLAEERYSRFCNTSALTMQLPCWMPVYAPLKGIARVATSKVVLQIIRAVMFYAVFSDKETESRAPDSVVLTALHLLSLGLDTCNQHMESGDKSCYNGDVMPLLDLSCEEVGKELFSGACGQSLLSLLVLYMRMHKRERMENIIGAENCDLSALIESLLKKLAEMDSGCMNKLQKLAPEVVTYDRNSLSDTISDNEKRKAKARERQAAILEKMRAEQSKFLQSLDSPIDDTSSGQELYDNNVKQDPEESIQDVCSLCHDSNSRVPVSYLILLQKSRLLSFVDRGPPSWEQAHRSYKNQTSTPGNFQSLSNTSTGSSGVVSSHMVQILVNQLANSWQPEEAELVQEFIHALFPSITNIRVQSNSLVTKDRNAYNFETLEEDMYRHIHKKMHDNLLDLGIAKHSKDAAISHENTGGDGDALLLGKYIAALSQERSESPSASDDRTSADSTLQPSSCRGFGPADCDGIYLSSCGHAVHQGCLDRYLSSLKERYVRRVVFEGGHIVDPDQGEFLCPVCRRLANSVLPALPGEVSKGVGSTDTSSPSAPLNEETYSLYLQQALVFLKSAADAVRNGEFIKAFPLQRNGKVRPNLEPVARMLTKMYFPGKQDKFFRSSRVNHSMIMWDTLKYSLISTEIAARCGRKSLTPELGLHSMYRELNSSTGFILSLLLKIVKSTRSKNTLHVIQRFRGLELLAESICSGISLDYSTNAPGQADAVFSILKHAGMGVPYPDIQIWNQASDPILARDPFSSLMWVLFCLPCPFLACKETFLYLVHLFYLVSVSQAVLACWGKFHEKLNELGLDNCLITGIFEAMGRSAFAQRYFVSSYINPSRNIKETIRSFSFPFMRRCALLWKLLNSSIPAPFSDGGEMMDVSLHVDAEMICREFESNEIHELEKMFNIPSLDFILHDKGVHSLVFKWFHHLGKDSEFCSLRNVMHVTPAVPFKLMELPHLYQDLLQRCIKQRCPDCKGILNEPALCLLCGRLCSPSWKSCCRESGCQTHAMACGAGTGVFLLIRRTTILLQRSARQAPWPSLYLDAFGEEDIEMHRGKPLYLNEERYAALTYLVASHGLDRSSKVLRQTTIGSFFLV